MWTPERCLGLLAKVSLLIASGVILTAVFFFNSIFPTSGFNAWLLFDSVLSVLPVNSDLSPSAESDQEAALPPIDTSLDDSEVVELLLGNKN